MKKIPAINLDTEVMNILEEIPILIDEKNEILETENGLLTPAHILYCEAIREQLNPNDKPIHVFYPGMGPDLSTILKSTNAIEISAVDSIRVNPYLFLEHLSNWKTVNDVQHNVDINKSISKDIFELIRQKYFYPHKLEELTEYNSEFFLEGLEYRKKRGFWYTGHIMACGIERAIASELKSLGVTKESISCRMGDKSEFILSFDYKGRERKCTYYWDEFDSYLKGIQTKNQIDVVDGIYMKAISKERAIRNGEQGFHHDLLRFCNSQNHFLVVGANLPMKDNPNVFDPEKFELLLEKSGYSTLEIDSAILKTVKEEKALRITSDENLTNGFGEYGWKMYGGTKSGLK